MRERRLPLEAAAHLITYGEHVFPLLLLRGLATRWSTAALRAVTLVIRAFAYPSASFTHLGGVKRLPYLVGRGHGALSLNACWFGGRSQG